MHNDYSDITSRIAEPPAWYDENGVPRYGEFTPRACPDIYWRECVLMMIACQMCGREFRVCISQSDMDAFTSGYTMAEWVQSGAIHYGDPPNACCQSGACTNCMDLRVLEFWRKELGKQYRVPELEIELPDAKEIKR